MLTPYTYAPGEPRAIRYRIYFTDADEKSITLTYVDAMPDTSHWPEGIHVAVEVDWKKGITLGKPIGAGTLARELLFLLPRPKTARSSPPSVNDVLREYDPEAFLHLAVNDPEMAHSVIMNALERNAMGDSSQPEVLPMVLEALLS
jgi:hypothetical protein